MARRDLDLQLGRGSKALLATDGTPATHAAFPRPSRPYLLIPIKAGTPAAESVRNYTVPDSRRVRWGLAAAGVLARAGITQLQRPGVALGGPGTFVEHLCRVLDNDDVVISVHLGPPRANRKPVIRVMDRRGRPLAFAKLGIGDLTNERVRHEAAALRLVDDASPPLVTPRLVASGTWRDHEYLVMKPLNTTPTRVPAAETRRRGRLVLDTLFPSTSLPIVSAPWWTRLRVALDEMPSSAEAVRLDRASEWVEREWGSVSIRAGAGHGDWSRWNMSQRGSDLVVWDWERFARDVPNDWDELHFAVGAYPGGVAASLSDIGAITASALPHLHREEASVILSTYLIQRGVAYLADGQLAAGARTGPLGEWLLPALDRVTGTGLR